MGRKRTGEEKECFLINETGEEGREEGKKKKKQAEKKRRRGGRGEKSIEGKKSKERKRRGEKKKRGGEKDILNFKNGTRLRVKVRRKK